MPGNSIPCERMEYWFRPGDYKLNGDNHFLCIHPGGIGGSYTNEIADFKWFF